MIRRPADAVNARCIGQLQAVATCAITMGETNDGYARNAENGGRGERMITAETIKAFGEHILFPICFFGFMAVLAWLGRD